MANVLITGANRGLGLELVRYLASLPPSRIGKIFATTRGAAPDSESELGKLVSSSGGRVVNVHGCEVTKQESVREAAARVEAELGAGEGLDILINNVGVAVANKGGMHTIDPAQFNESFHTNVVSAQMVTAAFVPLVKRSKEKKVIMVSSTVGAISWADRFHANGTPQYCITKAAMNSLGKFWSMDLDKDGFTVLMISPGWLKTDLGSQYADLEPHVGAKASADLILEAGRSKNGKFYNVRVDGWEERGYDGAEVSW
ncbi:hypothetical protein N3K66_003491 [Trichothecium roseum]|uniref:Uncharacterized protein n=1 Tax=Trichothecium roseum TaxID=47278 RepID=A0ACC0V5I2_9HYPO|nr:hypothetical protein N3K66_003491 [Trichothecium roseum]